jgi:hypothetical protein
MPSVLLTDQVRAARTWLIDATKSASFHYRE